MTDARARRILLVDADAFFVAVARLVDPEGAGRAPMLIVGGAAGSRGVVMSASYEARRFGVRSAMPISQALRLCPDAMCVPVPRGECGRKSREIARVLVRYAPVVEGASIDEWYCDLSGTEALYAGQSLADTAARIREAVRADTGLSVSIGGGPTKLIAKLAVELAKPKPGTGATGVFTVAPGEEDAFLRRFTLGDFPGVGPKFRERLASVGLHTVNDVLAHHEQTLASWIGERAAQWLLARAHGKDFSRVERRLRAKSISHEETFGRDLSADEMVEAELLRLCVQVATDLRGDQLTTRTVSVKLRDTDFRTRRASHTLPAGVVSDRVIFETARALLRRLRAARRMPVRLLGVALTSLAEPNEVEQLALFDHLKIADAETPRDRALAKAVDRLRAKFGDDAIGPARLTGR
jgi:DNA polymerase-4